ncbi:hypothetical protein [Ochrobactrum sp. EDr1-4]|uniref:hypothetical protein n=1 Tax=Ochrobactrum sp. EDr1-4 TaxID=3368622 RepID=UPI003BA028C8
MSKTHEFLESRIEALKARMDHHKYQLDLINRFPHPNADEHAEEVREYERRRDLDQTLLDRRINELAALAVGN